MSDSKNKKHGETIPPLPENILEDLEKAYHAAARKQRTAGHPMVFWENGRIVALSPDALRRIDEETTAASPP
jgi:ethanolamine ammonia-lyase large subunit